MKTKIYSYTLVFLQFFLILILLSINESIFSKPLSLVIFILGLSFGIYTLLFNKLSNFNISPLIKKDANLITNGAYKYIRHPMYFSVLLMLLAVVLREISSENIVLYLFLIVVLFLKAKKEEDLWMNENPQYMEYRKKTKMFIPFIL
ncbi:MAG: DUF1295 domain-containing protein [Campylobacteraceae bacterium]|nr:DUF1295 domain-containing protein [Campylobacteraceae bacterium]